MSSMKNLLVIVMLVAGSCAVYYAVNRDRQAAENTEEAPSWPGSPDVRMPIGSSSIANPPNGLASQYGQSGGSAAATVGSPNVPSPSAIGNFDNMQAPTAFVPPKDPPTAVDARMGAEAQPFPYAASTDPTAAATDPLQAGSADSFDAAYQTIQAKLDQSQLADALLDLSTLQDSGLVPQERISAVQELLDQLAGTVVYSREHLMEEPYTVRPGDTLEQIAGLYQVPARLLANINRVADPLEPGSQLKVVRGPFDARIDLTDRVLTLHVGGHYAGRFAIGVGQDEPNLEGTYVVSGQAVNPVYYGPDRTRAEANDPNNPLGEFLISLGSGPSDPGTVAIHGTNDPLNLHDTGGRGTIRLGDRDIEDVFGILSIGSRVVIRR